ncbi:MAG: aldo/keto reductase [Candidatus Brocadiaceae bacterium]|nr:aldo/keto reductase [Candidatus Brocadiaceae bacterium]
MQYGRIPGIDKDVSRLVMGIEVARRPDGGEPFPLMDALFERGATAFDTAHVYGEKAERTLGRWIAERGVRRQVVIIGKGAHPTNRQRVTPEDIASDLRESLERLGTDYIDLYLLHRDNPDVPVGPIVDALNREREAGLIRAFGGSNWTHQRLQQANEYAEAHGLTPLVASSPNYSLAEQIEETWAGCLSIGGAAGADARAWYRRTQMPVFAWSSMARGFMAGRITREAYEHDPGAIDEATRRGFCHEVNFRRLDRAMELARRKGVTVAQIAMAFVVSQGLNVFPICACMAPRELEENVAAMELRLTREECAWLDLERADV